MTDLKLEVSPTGELTLPESLRHSLHVPDGGVIFVREEAGTLVMESWESRIARSQAIVRKYARPGESVVDELIAERRAEAERE